MIFLACGRETSIADVFKHTLVYKGQGHFPGLISVRYISVGISLVEIIKGTSCQSSLAPYHINPSFHITSSWEYFIRTVHMSKTGYQYCRLCWHGQYRNPFHNLLQRQSVMAHVQLREWGCGKMANILHTTLWNIFSWMRMFEYSLYWNLSPWHQSTIWQHGFR